MEVRPNAGTTRCASATREIRFYTPVSHNKSKRITGEFTMEQSHGIETTGSSIFYRTITQGSWQQVSYD